MSKHPFREAVDEPTYRSSNGRHMAVRKLLKRGGVEHKRVFPTRMKNLYSSPANSKVIELHSLSDSFAAA